MVFKETRELKITLIKNNIPTEYYCTNFNISKSFETVNTCEGEEFSQEMTTYNFTISYSGKPFQPIGILP